VAGCAHARSSCEVVVRSGARFGVGIGRRPSAADAWHRAWCIVCETAHRQNWEDHETSAQPCGLVQAPVRPAELVHADRDAVGSPTTGAHREFSSRRSAWCDSRSAGRDGTRGVERGRGSRQNTCGRSRGRRGCWSSSPWLLRWTERERPEQECQTVRPSSPDAPLRQLPFPVDVGRLSPWR
jgi:hypothetical protein